MRKFTTILALVFANQFLFGQERFDENQLDNPNKFGRQIARTLPVLETANYTKTQPNTFYLENGLRSAKYVNASHWDSLKNEVEVQSIRVVFSKYPIKNGSYSMNHKLLFNRLKNLFSIDPMLNDSSIEWKIVLHTNCYDDNQVDTLFHGIEIGYKKQVITPVKARNKRVPNANAAIGTLESIQKFGDLPPDLSKDLEIRGPIEKTEMLVDYFEQLIQDTTPREIDQAFLDNHRHLIDRFIKTYGNAQDSIVFKVFDRNKHWKNALVIADWTGSMYQYGAQALLWHTLNFEQSGINYFTLFNDGDAKGTRKKKIGETGGIYYEQAENIDKIIALYQLVMLKGGGGDGPENDLEAILEGIERFPNHSEVVLIADNNACVRDMELLEYIERPVRVIICGYDNRIGINPQYLEIASMTGGSIHTIDIDINNLQVELGKGGEILSLLDYNFKIGSFYCDGGAYVPDWYKDHKMHEDIDSAIDVRHSVFRLDLSSNGLNKVPGKVKRFKNLKELDLSHNNLEELNNAVYRTFSIEALNLSNNNFSTLPHKLYWLRNLRSYDMSNNQLDTIIGLPKLDYLIHLDLSGNNFSTLPPQLNFRSLKYLNVDDNRLTKLPVSLARLKRLEELRLSNNNLDELPARIVYLKKLKLLDVSNNNLSVMPNKLSRLKNLEKLIISGNHFSDDYVNQLKSILPNTMIENQ